MNISYIIIHSTGKFGLAIYKWNRMSVVQKMWVGFKQFFWTGHQELRDTTDLIVQDTGMHHSNMVRNVVSGLQEVLQKEKTPTETAPVISEPNYHVANAVQNTQQQLAAQLQHIYTMIQDMQLQYATAQQPTHQDYVVCGYYGGQNNFRD